MQGISLLFLKNHFGDISCLTVFGIVILADSELHRSGSSFMSQSHVTCQTNVITKMVLFSFVGHNYKFPIFLSYLIQGHQFVNICLCESTPYPILSQHACGNVPTHYLILSYLPSYPDPKSGEKQGLCAGCPPLYTLASPSGGNPRNDQEYSTFHWEWTGNGLGLGQEYYCQFTCKTAFFLSQEYRKYYQECPRSPRIPRRFRQESVAQGKALRS